MRIAARGGTFSCHFLRTTAPSVAARTGSAILRCLALLRCRRLPRVIVAIRACLTLGVMAACERATPLIGDGIARDAEDTGRLLIERALAERGFTLHIADWTEQRPHDLSRDVNQALEFALNENVVVVVGHAGSRASLLAAKPYNEIGVPQLVPNATGGALWQAGPYTFPLAPSNAEQAEVLLSFAIDTLRADSVSLIYVGDTYGADLRDQVDSMQRNRNRALTTQTLVTGRECATGDSLAARALARAHLARAHSDVVIIATSRLSGNCLAAELLAVDATVRLLFSDSGDPEESASSWSDAQRARVWRLSLWLPDSSPQSRRLAALSDSITGRALRAEDAFHYDAYLVASTALASGVRSRRQMESWLRALGRSTPPVDGLTGPIHFNGRREHRMRVVALSEPLP